MHIVQTTIYIIHYTLYSVYNMDNGSLQESNCYSKKAICTFDEVILSEGRYTRIAKATVHMLAMLISTYTLCNRICAILHAELVFIR